MRTIFSSPSRGKRCVTSAHARVAPRRGRRGDGKRPGSFFRKPSPAPPPCHVKSKSPIIASTRQISLPTPTKVQGLPIHPARNPKRAPTGLPSRTARVSGGVRAGCPASAATASEPHPYWTARGLPKLPDAEGAHRSAVLQRAVHHGPRGIATAKQSIATPSSEERRLFTDV